MIRKVAQLSGHSGSVYALCERDEKTIFSAGSDRKVGLWDLETFSSLPLTLTLDEAIYAIRYDSGNGFLYIGDAAGSLTIFDVDAKKEVATIPLHSAGIFDIAFSEDLIITASADGSIGVTEKATLGAPSYIKTGSKVRKVLLQGKVLLAACGDGVLREFDLQSLSLLFELASHTDACNALALAPADGLIITGGKDAYLKCWGKNKEIVREVAAHNYAIYAILTHYKYPYIVSASRDKTLKIWNYPSLDLKQRIDRKNHDGHVASVNCAIWHSGGLIISGSDDKMINLWSVD